MEMCCICLLIVVSQSFACAMWLYTQVCHHPKMHSSHSIQAVTMFLCLDTQHSGCNSVSLLRQYTSLHTAGATDGNTVSLFSLLLTWTAWSVSRVTDTTNALHGHYQTKPMDILRRSSLCWPIPHGCWYLSLCSSLLAETLIVLLR